MATSWSLFRDPALCEEAPVFAAELPVRPNEAYRLTSASSVAAGSAARSDSRIQPCVESSPRRCRRSISARPSAACERFRCSPVHVASPRALPADRPCSATPSLFPAPVVSPRFFRFQGSVDDFALWPRTPRSATPRSQPVQSAGCPFLPSSRIRATPPPGSGCGRTDLLERTASRLGEGDQGPGIAYDASHAETSPTSLFVVSSRRTISMPKSPR